MDLRERRGRGRERGDAHARAGEVEQRRVQPVGPQRLHGEHALEGRHARRQARRELGLTLVRGRPLVTVRVGVGVRVRVGVRARVRVRVKIRVRVLGLGF